jgi:hypothetical protein
MATGGNTWDNTDTFSKSGSKAGDLQRAVYDLLNGPKHAGTEGGLPTSVRFLYYELVQAGVIPKQYETGARTPDQDMSLALMHLRQTGQIDWDWIIDESRSLTDWAWDTTMYDYMEREVKSARLDCWNGTPHPLILCESRSVAGVLRDIAGEYLCPIAATNGQCGGFLRTVIIPRIADRQEQIVIYLGDLDVQGIGIEANARKVIEAGVGGTLMWDRLALTEEQVQQYNIPANDKLDNRTGVTSKAYETEGLSQIVIQGLLRDRLDVLLLGTTGKSLDRVRIREERERVKILKRLKP